jgi:hypothetical protein
VLLPLEVVGGGTCCSAEEVVGGGAEEASGGAEEEPLRGSVCACLLDDEPLGIVGFLVLSTNAI